MFGKIRLRARAQRMPPCSGIWAVVPRRILRLDGGVTTRNQRDSAMLDRPGPRGEQTAGETAERWIDALNAALGGGQAAALSELFVTDSHWRNLFGISWYFATFSGNATVVAELSARAAAVRATGFRVDHIALAPRHAVVAGRDVIEAVFAFETANGP